MSEKMNVTTKSCIKLAGDIVAAYISNNPVPALELPNLIQSVHDAIAALNSGGMDSSSTAAEMKLSKPSPVQIRQSIQHDGIISFIDGKTYKTLKRHLTSHGLHPKSYCERYGLPSDYPMVASGYAERRSALAKKIGLGRLRSMAEHSRNSSRTA